MLVLTLFAVQALLLCVRQINSRAQKSLASIAGKSLVSNTKFFPKTNEVVLMIATVIQRDNTSVLVHDDYCQATSPDTISDVIQQISRIVSSAYGRTSSGKESTKTQ